MIIYGTMKMAIDLGKKFTKSIKKLAGLARSAKKRKEAEKKAEDWFRGKVKDMANLKDKLSGKDKKTRKDFIEGGREVDKFVPGTMLTYYYDPKWKKILPYYDRFPMILLLEVYNDGWLGINLHYFPPSLRAVILGRMMSTAGAFLTKNQKMRINYRIVKASSNLAVGKVALKRYLTSHVRSKIIQVHPREWEHAAMLPLDIFTKASAQQVWRDTVKEIKKRGYQ
jgi:hypothetical protein